MVLDLVVFVFDVRAKQPSFKLFWKIVYFSKLTEFYYSPLSGQKWKRRNWKGENVWWRVFNWPSAKRVTPDHNKAVSTACFDPVVQVGGIRGQTGLCWLSRGISKTCQKASCQEIYLAPPQGGSNWFLLFPHLKQPKQSTRTTLVCRDHAAANSFSDGAVHESTGTSHSVNLPVDSPL